MKKEIIIQFDFSHGPLWKDKLDLETGAWTTGIPCIDNDMELQSINDETANMYNSLYSFNDVGGGCQFDETRFGEIKAQLRSLVSAMIERLAEINDGSFIVVDKTNQILN